MSDTTPVLGLPLIMPSQAQKHVTHNEAIRMLDAITQISVASRALGTPPATPATGECHIVAAGGSGAWAGQDNRLSIWDGYSWTFLAPRPGWAAWITDEGAQAIWNGTAWTVPAPVFQDLDGVGVNATSDPVNRLSVSASATLLNHDGGGHQLKINKAGAGDTASLLFQSNFSGRAEMGLAGDDDFHLKISPDGSSFAEALVVEGATGATRVKGLMSGRITVNPDAVSTIIPPAPCGFLLIHNSHFNNPQIGHAGMVIYITGTTPRMVTVWAGSQFENHNRTELTGTVSASGNSGISAQEGEIQIENRHTAAKDYTYTFFCGL